MTKEPEWAVCVSVHRRTTVAMEVKSWDAVQYCALICNACRLFCYTPVFQFISYSHKLQSSVIFFLSVVSVQEVGNSAGLQTCSRGKKVVSLKQINALLFDREVTYRKK